nr:MAG TPA: hypothetical protein [Caudoviricetes sp.]
MPSVCRFGKTEFSSSVYFPYASEDTLFSGFFAFYRKNLISFA